MSERLKVARPPFCISCGENAVELLKDGNEAVSWICTECGAAWPVFKTAADSNLLTKLDELKRDVRMWMNTATRMMLSATDIEGRARNDGKADAYAHMLAVLDERFPGDARIVTKDGE